MKRRCCGRHWWRRQIFVSYRQELCSSIIVLSCVAAAGACEAGEAPDSGMRLPLHGQAHCGLPGRQLPVHAAGGGHGRRVLHVHAGPQFPLAALVSAKTCSVASSICKRQCHAQAQTPSISAAAPALIVSQSTERLQQSLSRAVAVTFLMTFCLHAESAGRNFGAGSAVLRRRRSAGPGIHAASRPRLAVRLEFRVSEPESSPAEAVRVYTCRHTGLRRGRRCAWNSVQSPTEEMLPTPNRYQLEP